MTEKIFRVENARIKIYASYEYVFGGHVSVYLTFLDNSVKWTSEFTLVSTII
jgi:hypothetical protein